MRSRKMAATLSEELQRRNIESSFFHGGITPEEKVERLKNWKVGLIKCMVATTAFGMGIDKADVDLVIHFHLPESLESYVQESGRAGRNGFPSKAIITYNNADVDFLKNQFLGSLPETKYVKLVYRKLNNYFQIAYGEGENRSFPFSFIEFCKTYNLKSLITYNTLESLDRNGILRLSKVNRNQCEVKFTCTNSQLFNYYNKNRANELIVKSVLRTYGGIFDDLVAIN
ncbi:MAG: helicase-related protein, partial [bacterium]